MSELGEVIPLGVIVRDTEGVPVNATTVVLRVQLPDGTVVLPVVVNPPPTPGRYAVDYVPTMPGLHIFRWEVTEPDLVYETGEHVDPPMSVGLIPLTAAKRLLRIRDGDHDHDRDVADAVWTATELAEQERGEVLLRRTVVEDRDLGRAWVGALALVHRPAPQVVSVTRLNAYGQPIETLLPPTVWVDSRGILRTARGISGLVRITYVAGYPVVPPTFRTAIGYILQSVWANRQGSAGRPRAGGQQAADQAGDESSIPTRAQDLLGTRKQSPLVG